MRWFWLAVLLLICPAAAQTFNGLKSGSVAKVSAAGCSQATTALSKLDGSEGATVDTALTTMICGLVTDGVWSKYRVFQFYALNSSANALKDLTGNGFNGTNHGATFTAAGSAAGGFTGTTSSTTIWVDTGYNPNADGLNSNAFHTAVWSNTAIGIDGEEVGLAGTASLIMDVRLTSDVSFYRLLEAISPGVANLDGRGLYTGNRSDSTHNQGYKNATDQGVANETSAGGFTNCDVFTTNVDDNSTGCTSGVAGSARQLMVFTMGPSLTATDVTHACARINTALQSIAGITNYAGC